MRRRERDLEFVERRNDLVNERSRVLAEGVCVEFKHPIEEFGDLTLTFAGDEVTVEHSAGFMVSAGPLLNLTAKL